MVLAALLCSIVSPARGSQLHPHLTILHSFQNGSDGAQPLADLIEDTHGNFYGTSAGMQGPVCPPACGAVFKLSPPSGTSNDWEFLVLYDFIGGSDGGIPHGNVIFGPDGNLYGTNVRGGSQQYGGVVYQLKPPAKPSGPWIEHTLHNFGQGLDGDAPQGGLVFDRRGNLYGTTALGGRYGGGTAFELSPPSHRGGGWTETVLHSFGLGTDANFPVAGLAVDKAGDLFGTTEYGGVFSSYCESGCGTVYELSAASQGNVRTYSILVKFNGKTDGSTPGDPLIFDAAGNLYGTTLDGQGNPSGGYGGSAFELTPPSWTETVLYLFPKYLYDAGYSSARLIFDSAGNLYGTSQSGGPRYEGTAFKLMPPATKGGVWTDSILHNFNKAGGGATYPFNGLLFGPGGTLIGTTPYGGNGPCTFGRISGCGTIFQITP
jgi:uncharacterized repeat protein (TIGR03803 family)